MRIALLVTAMAVPLACSSGSPRGSDETVASASPPVTAIEPAPTTRPPTSPPTTSPPTTSRPTSSLPTRVRIDVVVGVDDGPDRIERIALGSEVVLTITNPDHHDEFHVHTLDLVAQVEAGEVATFTFVADVPGAYEVESHDTDDVLVVLEVG